MILIDYIEITLNTRNIKKIRKWKKEELNIGDRVVIPINLLDKGSHVRISCKCDICGKEKEIAYQKYTKNINNGDYYSCSSKCSQDKVKKTSMYKWGVDYYTKTEEYKVRSGKTNSIKWGSEYYLTSKEGLSKTKKVMLDRWGVDNPFKSKEIQEKIKLTNTSKWGVSNPSNSDFIKNKIGLETSKTWNKKYKKYYKENHNLDVISYTSGVYRVMCNKCNDEYDIDKFLLANRILINTEICTKCNKLRCGSSGYENELKNYIKSIYSGEIIENSKSIISPYEIDIYLPDIGIAIEFNGLYWHSDKWKDKWYHLNKYEMCLERGINLVQIWQDDWLYKNNIIKSILAKKIGKISIINSESCELVKISRDVVSDFLSKNHLLGKSESTINIGLIYKGEVVSIMSFIRDSVDGYTLTRHCDKMNLHVLGASFKLISYFKNNYIFKELVVYHDKSLGFSNYESLGFKRLFDYEPDFNYINSGIRSKVSNKKDSLKIYGVGKSKFLLEGRNIY